MPIMHSEVCPALKARDHKGPSSDGDGDGAILVPMQPIAFDAYNQTTSETVAALRCAAGGVFDNTVAHAFKVRGGCEGGGKGYLGSDDVAFTISTMQDQQVAQPIAYAFDSLASNSMKSANPASGCNQVDVSKALDTSRGLDPSCNQGGIGVAQAMAVRRLTPVECERLQGFPDRYTDIQPKGKATPDGPRYKALGNSMAVPVMAWIGKRIQEVDAICKTQQKQ